MNYLIEEVRSPDVIPIIGNQLLAVLQKHEHPELDACATRSLYLNDDIRGTDIFQKKLHDENPEIRRTYLLVFSEIDDEYIQSEFNNALESEPLPDLCLEFARKLTIVPESDKIKSVIHEELESVDPHRRWMAIQVATQINSDWSQKKLASACEEEPEQALRRLIGMSLSS